MAFERVLRDEVGLLPEAVARSFDLDDDGAVEQAIGGEDRVAKDLSPFGEVAVMCRR